jgi:hypothetical protein
MLPGHLWECDPVNHICYDPPGGEMCAPCSGRDDCGDGGADSDDWCIYDGWDGACSKDCVEDADCPGGTYCVSFPSSATACAPDDVSCVCRVRVGNCNVLNSFGTACGGDAACRTCEGCDMMVCPDGYWYCTFPCTVPEDCPWDARCDGTLCRR